MQAVELKNFIKNKFGTISKFAVLAKQDQYELQKFFAVAERNTGIPGSDKVKAREKRIQSLHKLAEKTKVKPTTNEIDDATRERIADGVKEFGGIRFFCSENPEFTEESVSHIIVGRRKRLTPMVKKLLKTLKIDGTGKN